MADRQPDKSTVETVLAEFRDPETGRPLTDTGQIHDLRLDATSLDVTVDLSTHVSPLWEETRQKITRKLKTSFPTLSKVTVRISPHASPAEKLGELGLTIKSVVAVGSGKGGVGKSTLAASIAFGLQRYGASVGLMDADVYGPSIPHLLGVNERPTAVDNKLQPVVANGMKVMSMGFLVPPGEAIVWRGPMLHGAITQFLRDTDWGELDYLIIDMPPGTGDIALTLSQLLPLRGAVVVCTPQDVAWLDAVKAIAMFRKVQIPVLGVVENMSFFECPDCGKRYDLFGSGGARRHTEEFDVPFLGEVPINIEIRVRGDEGRTQENIEDAISAPYLDAICVGLARSVAAQTASPALPSL